MTITQRDREEWAHHPVTEEFLATLQDSRQSTMEAWASELFTADTAEKTLQQNATALGGIRVLVDLADIIIGYRGAEEVEGGAV